MSRLSGKPFEIIAVSVDAKKESVAQLMSSLKMPGVVAWEKGEENPVAELYNAIRLPTWYVIDKDGVIRSRDPRSEDLVSIVEALLAGKTLAGKTLPAAGPTDSGAAAKPANPPKAAESSPQQVAPPSSNQPVPKPEPKTP